MSTDSLYPATQKKRCTVSVYLPEGVFETLEQFKNSRGMFLSRFVEKALKEYMAQPEIMDAIVHSDIKQIFRNQSHAFILDTQILEGIRTWRSTSGIALSKIVAKCLVYAVEELKYDAPLGSTVLAQIEKRKS